MPYFFLSYARGTDDGHVKKFFADLCNELRRQLGTNEEEVGFLACQHHVDNPGAGERRFGGLRWTG